MSYARMSDTSDVYIYHHYAGFIECCGCRLTAPEEYEEVGFARLYTAREALTHLDWHVREGDKVPSNTFERIREEYSDLDVPIEPYVTPPEVEERRQKRMQEIFNKNKDVDSKSK